MGWNQGFKILEDTVLEVYEKGALNKEMLSILLNPYKGTDIDTGGWQEKKAKDGLDVIEIMIKTYYGELKKEPKREDYETEEEYVLELEEYQDEIWDLYFEIQKAHGIR